MDTQPVAEGVGDPGVELEFLLELPDITNIVNRFLEFTAKAGSYAGDSYLKPFQFCGYKIVGSRSSGCRRLIDGDFKVD